MSESKHKLNKRKFPKGREVTPEVVREYEGFENVSDKEAEEISRFFRLMSKLFFDVHMREVKHRWEGKNGKQSEEELNINELTEV